MNLKTYEEYSFQNKDYSKYIDLILTVLYENKIEYDDLYRTDNHLYLYIVNKCPFSFSFIQNTVQIIVEIDGITDTLGTYDIDKNLRETIENVVINFDVDEYRENQ